MPGEPQNRVMSLLREIREKLDAHDTRFDTVDKKHDSLRQAVNGESVLGRYAAAEVEERLDSIEKRLSVLEKGPGKKPPTPRKPTS
jgi:chaperonin cofactor prefoldin